MTMQIDLHGFCLNDAKEEVFWKLKDAFSTGERNFIIIHGYRNGQILKNYFQSKEFIEDMEIFGYILVPKINIKNPGMTCYELHSKKQKK